MKRVKTLNTPNNESTPVKKPSRLVSLFHEVARDPMLQIILIFGIGTITLLVLMVINSTNS